MSKSIYLVFIFLFSISVKAQDKPDMFAMIANSAGNSHAVATITKNGKTFAKMNRTEGQWFLQNTESPILTQNWTGWAPINPDVLESARFMADPTPGAILDANGRVYVYRALIDDGINKKSQKIAFDYDGKINEVSWLVVNEAGASVPLANPNGNAFVAKFIWSGQQLSSFSFGEQGLQMNFKYDKVGKLTEIRGTEASKSVLYRIAYK